MQQHTAPPPKTLAEAQEEIQALRRQAEEAGRSKSRFLANISHEIRTPMNAIKGLSELLALTQLDSLQRSYVNNILSAASSLISIINDVLDFARLDSNSLSLAEGPYNLAELLAEVSNVSGLRSEGRDVLLLVDAKPDMPAALWGDDVRIKQVMTNLISNAIQYTEEGSVQLTLETRPSGEQVQLCCSVSDTGAGIRAEDMDGLFDAFTRIDLAQNHGVAGTGLGLAIARHLVQAMGGEISVESEFGKGSVFSFWVPQRVVDPVPMARLDNAAGLRVLLCGSPLRTANIASMLSAMGAAYEISGDGALRDGAVFTHCIHDVTLSQRRQRQLRRQLEGCSFAVLRNMQGVLQAGEADNTMLFTPLLVTDLARFLNLHSHADRQLRPAQAQVVSPAEASAELTVRDTRLLVVDDNEVNLMVGSEMLAAFGARVDCAGGGEEALAVCEATRYDIIFMDHMMPGMDGLEVTARLRGGGSFNRQTPIVALTANVANDMQSYYVRCGMDDYIGKPVALSDLARVLVRWLPADKLAGGPKSP